MPKPDTIDRRQCRGLADEEAYKELVAADYWWAFRELAAHFAENHLRTVTGAEPSGEYQREFGRLQILHYTVHAKLAGSYHQLAQMSNHFPVKGSSDQEMQMRLFEIREALDALHNNLYQAVLALATEVFIILGGNINPKRAPGIATVKEWLRMQNKTRLRNLLEAAEKALDIRDHVTHLGAIPMLLIEATGNLEVRECADWTTVLTRHDLRDRAPSGETTGVLDSSKSRIRMACSCVNDVYQALYEEGAVEQYLSERGLCLDAGWRPYWDRGGHFGNGDDRVHSATTDPASGVGKI